RIQWLSVYLHPEEPCPLYIPEVKNSLGIGNLSLILPQHLLPRLPRHSELESGGSNPTTSDSYGDRASARARREAREARLATLTSRVEEDSNRDYKKLYESALTENQKLKTKLQEAQLELADIKSKLEKQKQEKTSDRSSVLEMEKRRRALERKMSEMEEEMKVLTELKSDNQRLKDENGALIRVISKLSK
uniref:Protein phosphatase 1 regulatory subunit 12B n=1 Tax=Macaca mulatta TaxID=9544 RepID=A0A1D5QDX2_MACMU